MKVENLEKIIKHLLIMSFHDAAEEQKMMKREKKGDIWNELQPHFCNNLSLIFGKLYLIQVITFTFQLPNKE